MPKTVSLAILALALAGCAAHGASAPSADRTVLLAEELDAVQLTWAYETIQRLRPEWLRSRGQTSLTRRDSGVVAVYMDGMRYGDRESLRTVRVADVREIRYLTGPEATHRFGTGVSGGVIHVLTK
jgi:hypothetical protein